MDGTTQNSSQDVDGWDGGKQDVGWDDRTQQQKLNRIEVDEEHGETSRPLASMNVGGSPGSAEPTQRVQLAEESAPPHYDHDHH